MSVRRDTVGLTFDMYEPLSCDAVANNAVTCEFCQTRVSS